MSRKSFAERRVVQNDPIVVRSWEALGILTGLPRRTVGGGKIHIALELPELEPTVRTQYELRLSRLYSECGCALGAATGAVFVGCYAISLIAAGGSYPSLGILVLGFVIFLLGVGVGKSLGLVRARTALRRTIAHLLQEGSLHRPEPQM